MAGATLVEIEVIKDVAADRLEVSVTDNGRGIAPSDLKLVTDPFFTTRTTRRVGLGLSLLSQTAERCQGSFDVESRPGRGARVTAEFGLSHIDRPPLGDMAGTIISLVIGRPDIDFIYRQRSESGEFLVDTRQIKAALDGVPLSNPEVIAYLRETIGQGTKELGRL